MKKIMKNRDYTFSYFVLTFTDGTRKRYEATIGGQFPRSNEALALADTVVAVTDVGTAKIYKSRHGRNIDVFIFDSSSNDRCGCLGSGRFDNGHHGDEHGNRTVNWVDCPFHGPILDIKLG